jgi:hypothetical protein
VRDDTKDPRRPSRSPAGSPVVIEFGNSSGGGSAEMASTADRMMMPMGKITYVFDGTAPDLGASSGGLVVVPRGSSADLGADPARSPPARCHR